MKGSAFLRFAVLLSTISLVLGADARAEDHAPIHFAGLLNDYVPATPTAPLYEMHGTWTMDIDERSGTADFEIVMTMANWATTTTTPPVVDPSQPGQVPHTHHIRMSRIPVIANSPSSPACPAYKTPTYGGFQFTGQVSLLTGNGSDLSADPAPPQSQLQVCVTGGQADGSIPFSNITVTFQPNSPGIKHFGAQPIHGVVRSWNNRWDGLERLGIHF
jgi:hypothetical protein